MSNATKASYAPYRIVYTAKGVTLEATPGTHYSTLDDAEEAMIAWRDSDDDPTLRIVDCDGEVTS